MKTVALSAAWLLNETWTVRGSVGAIVDGSLKQEMVAEINPGGLVALGVEYRALNGHDSVPFVDLSLFLGASWAETEHPDFEGAANYFATDARLGARAGWSLGGDLFPYAAARVFGGPVKWDLNGEDLVGTDVHHYQLALGAAVQLGPVAVYAEWAGLGEKGLSAGLSTAW